jgi:hypothetical protein
MRCKANTRSGDQCRNNAISGTSFCYIASHGGIQKTFPERAYNFIQNKWLGFSLPGAVSLIIGIAGCPIRRFCVWGF